jgi:hypothetical protein
MKRMPIPNTGENILFYKTNGDLRQGTVMETSTNSFMVKWKETQTNQLGTKRLYSNDFFVVVPGWINNSSEQNNNASEIRKEQNLKEQKSNPIADNNVADISKLSNKKKLKNFSLIQFLKLCFKALWMSAYWYNIIMWIYISCFFSAVVFNFKNNCNVPISYKLFSYTFYKSGVLNCDTIFQAVNFTFADGLGLFLRIFGSSVTKDLSFFSSCLVWVNLVSFPFYMIYLFIFLRINFYALIKKN